MVDLAGLGGGIWGLSVALFQAALLASERKDPRRAAMLFSASEARHASIGATLMSFMTTRLIARSDAARAVLGAEQYDEAWTAGAQLSLDAAVAEAMVVLDSDQHGAPREVPVAL